MRKLRSRKLINFLLIATLSVFVSSCATIGIPLAAPIDIPARPVLAVCPELPVIEGILIEQGGETAILLPLVEAEKLRTFIHTFIECSVINQIELLGHIEKLENRLKALGGN